MQPTNPLLPALRPDTPALLRRTGSLLGAVQGIQQEANAEWWFQQGMALKEADEWGQAAFCFGRVIELDNTHWRGWLLAGLSYAHLDKFEQCMTAIFGAERYGRPKREADSFSLFTPSESTLLSEFLSERKGESRQYLPSATLALVHFYNHNLELAEQLLFEAEVETVGQEGWKQYLLSRIAFEKGNIEDSVIDLSIPMFNELAKNPRALFWIGRSCVQSIKILESQWVFYEEVSEEYLPNKIVQRIELGIHWLEKATAIGPVCAEYYFTIGQAKQLLDRRWGGVGLREYYAAVELEPGNKEYIMARYGAIYNWPQIMEDVQDLIACVEAADICPSDRSLQRNVMQALCDTNNFASCLLQFNKINGFLYKGIVISESKYEDETQWLTECVAALGGIPDMNQLQALAEAERASWNELLKTVKFYDPIENSWSLLY